MKKRWIVCLLSVLLCLTGCGERIPEDTIPIYSVPEETIITTECVETETMENRELLGPLITPKNEDLVRVTDYIPGILTDLKYSTEDNFTGQPVYAFQDVFLRYGTVMKLRAVAEELNQLGLNLKIWDGFRPVSAQFRLWEICPDDTYVANPNVGYSNHSRGFAVDVTLVDAQGREVDMPTSFDDFSKQADRDYSDCTPEQKENAQLLERIMEKNGFSGYWGEWWHFNDTDKYDVETCFDPAVISRRQIIADTQLLSEASAEESSILQIPAGEDVTFLGSLDGNALVEYWGYRGYVPVQNLME